MLAQAERYNGSASLSSRHRPGQEQRDAMQAMEAAVATLREWLPVDRLYEERLSGSQGRPCMPCRWWCSLPGGAVRSWSDTGGRMLVVPLGTGTVLATPLRGLSNDVLPGGLRQRSDWRQERILIVEFAKRTPTRACP
jgi:hypothetical protein